jgi:hypothetical protein
MVAGYRRKSGRSWHEDGAKGLHVFALSIGASVTAMVLVLRWVVVVGE